jgi:hypothetical protein
VLLDEIDRLPVGFLNEIVECRAYARAYYANEANPDGWNSSALRILAQTIKTELVQEAIDAEKAHG